MNAIEVVNLSKYYGRARGIVDVNLTVEAGDFFGFIGPNGAGKSTLIRTLLGLINPTSGSASIFGMDITANRLEILKNVGYLPSDAAFYDYMKVGDLLKYSAALRHLDCSEEARMLCERLELDTDRKIGDLSLGNRKKVGIVAALQHKPSLYILDEPTSGLDPLMQKQFYTILEERNKDGATVFLSSHILSEVAKYCRGAAIIREGRILLSDRVSILAHTGVKRVNLKTEAELPALEGARNATKNGDAISFLYSGSIPELIGYLSKLPITDLNISDPDLDEVFMNYYVRGESK